MKTRTRSLSVVFALMAPVMLMTMGSGCSSCKKDDDDKPVPSAAPTPAPTPVAPATVTPEEDAGAPDADAGDGGKPVVPGGGAAGSIAKCCAALQQNVNSAPLDQKPYYMAASNACNGMRGTPSAQQAFGQIRMFLAGAKMPGACK
jgi:hypothetical protein